jgi:hypothetical protein
LSNAADAFCAAVSSLTVPQAASPAVSRAVPVAMTTVARVARAMAVLMVGSWEKAEGSPDGSLPFL